MRHNKLLTLALCLSTGAALAEKVSFDIPTGRCRVKFKNRKEKASKFSDFKEQLTAGTEARGLVKKNLILFKVRDSRYHDYLFLAKKDCILAQSSNGGGGQSQADSSDSSLGPVRHKGVYAKVFPVYFTEPLLFVGTNGKKDVLRATDIGAAFGLGYDFGLIGAEVLPVFAMSKVKNNEAVIGNTYTGNGMVLGSLVNIVAHFQLSNSFGAGPFIPLVLRYQKFPLKAQGQVSTPTFKVLYGAGLSLRLDLGVARLALQMASMGFKSDFMFGLGLEYKL